MRMPAGGLVPRPSADGPGPRAIETDDALVIDGRHVAGFELAPVALELLDAVERTAALEALAAWYDAIGRPFALLSVPARRDPGEHLAQVEERVPSRTVGRLMRPYAALLRQTAGDARMPHRRTILTIDAVSAVELRRAADLVERVAQERGVVIRPLTVRALAEAWSSVARPGDSYRIGAAVAEGPGLLAPLLLGAAWPAAVEPGWLARLAGGTGVAAASLRVRPLGRAEAMTYLTTRLRVSAAAERLSAERGDIADVERERLSETAEATRRAVAGGQRRLSFVDVVILVQADTPDELAERIATLRLDAQGMGFELRPATFRVGDAWRSVVPGPAGRDLAPRNVDSPTLAASLLHVASDLYEPAGHLVGRVRSTGAPIIVDRFAHASHNAIVLGQTGTGKTMATGAEIVRNRLRGVRVLVVDPLGDYRRLTEGLGGTYVALGSPGAGIDPFALGGAPRTEGAFVAKLGLLGRLVGAMAGGLARDERGALDRALRAAYADVGIGPDPATHDRRSPTLAKLVVHLAAERDGRALGHRLERWATGSLAGIFTTDRALPVDEGLLVIGLTDIGDDEVRSVAQLAALAVLWDRVRADLAPKLVVVDEAWKVMRQPSGAAFVEELARSARHFHAGLQLATQDIVEFLRSDFGESIIKQCDMRILLGQTPEGVDALARFFDLTQAERRMLLHARPGEGLLFVGASHTAFDVIVSRREYALLTTRPADLLAQSHSRYDTPDTG